MDRRLSNLAKRLGRRKPIFGALMAVFAPITGLITPLAFMTCIHNDGKIYVEPVWALCCDGDDCNCREQDCDSSPAAGCQCDECRDLPMATTPVLTFSDTPGPEAPLPSVMQDTPVQCEWSSPLALPAMTSRADFSRAPPSDELPQSILLSTVLRR